MASGNNPARIFDLMSEALKPRKFQCRFFIRNDGELTIRDPAIEIEALWGTDAIGSQLGMRLPLRRKQVGEVLYPGEEREVDDAVREIAVKKDAQFKAGDLFVGWRVFLDNSPPSRGTLDLGEAVREAVAAAGPQ